MSAKHTPGPWIIDDIYGLILAKANGAEIAALHSGIEANARLIAAAPDLLRELSAAIFYIETYGGDFTDNFAAGGNLDQVKAIIRKAKGDV